MSYLIKSVSCYIAENSFDNGESTKTFHSYRYDIGNIVESKEGLIQAIQTIVGKGLSDEDLDIDGNSINVHTLVSYEVHSQDQFPIATKDEIEQWKRGEKTLYSAIYTFNCLSVSDLKF